MGALGLRKKGGSMLKDHNHWWLLVQPTPHSQRFFRLKDDARPRFDVFLCDNSGSNPDMTDDGPLRVDVKRPMKATKDNKFYAPVIVERTGSKCVVVLDLNEAARLVGLVPDLKVQWPEESMMNLRAVLDAPVESPDVVYDCDCCENLGFLIVTKEGACINKGPEDAKEPIIIECDTCESMKARGRSKDSREAEQRFWDFWCWFREFDNEGFMALAKRYLHDKKLHEEAK
jgi:hypothetical protein